MTSLFEGKITFFILTFWGGYFDPHNWHILFMYPAYFCVPPLSSPAQSAYDFQTYCSVERTPFTEFREASGAPLISSYKKPEKRELTAFIFKKGENIVLSYFTGARKSSSDKPTIANGIFPFSGTKEREFLESNQFRLQGNHFLPSKPVSCDTGFIANGWSFSVNNGAAIATKGVISEKIQIAGSFAYSFAESRGSVFVGSNAGEALLFRGGEWCVMNLMDDAYICRKGKKSPQLLGRQFYSSLSKGDISLIGDYPNGWVWRFDGETLTKDSRFTPPQYMGSPITPGFEIQALATYCGSLYLGVWPYGELFRYDGNSWSKPFSLFPSSDFSPPDFPHEAISQTSKEVSNFLGRRITSMVVQDESLFIVTSNKWPSQTMNNVYLSNDALKEYGAVYKLSDPYCLNSEQLANLEVPQFKLLSPKQISDLRRDQITKLSPVQIAKINAKSFAYIKEDTFQGFSDFQLTGLSSRQTKSLKNAKIKL